MSNKLNSKLNQFLNDEELETSKTKKVKKEKDSEFLYVTERDELVERVDRPLKFKDGRQLLREQLYETN